MNGAAGSRTGQTHKWARVAVAAGLAGFGAVLFDPAAPAALALAAPPAPPITVPSSVIGSLDSATALERARMVGNVIPGGPSAIPASAWGTVAKGGTAVMVGVTGFFIGFEGTNAVLRWAGVDDVGLEALFPTTVAAGFVPNADIDLVEPGWVGGDQVVNGSWSKFGGPAPVATTLTFVVVSAPPVGVAGTLVFRVYPNTPSPDPSVTTVVGSFTMLSQSGGVVITSGGGGGYLTINPSGYWQTSLGITGAYPQGYGLRAKVSGSQVGYADWWAVGSQLRPPDQIVDPTRAWETRWTCSDASEHSVRSVQFQESDSVLPAVPVATCAMGSPVSVEVWEIAPLGGAMEVLIESWTPTQALLDWQTNYPQCTDGSCRLLLSRIDATTATRLSCFANPSLCVDWWQDPARADNYECTYGGSVVELGECAVYAPTFNVATGVDVQTDTGTQPAGETGPYADPATGEPVPADDPTPAPEPGTQDDACPPPFTWTAMFNLWWYYKGAVCAMESAFVPPAGLVETEVQTTVAVLSTRPPWSMLEPIGGVFTGLGDGWSTGCGELPDFDPYGNGLQLPCDPPSSAWMTVLYALGSFVVVVGTGFGVWHMVVAAIGGRSADS